MFQSSTTPRRVSGMGRKVKTFALAIMAFAFVGLPALATTVKKMNLVDLIQHSDTIVAGRVESVNDGFDTNGIPYTEITLKVGEKIRGEVVDKTFTFRQFGLLEPRKMPSGKINVTVVPDGWARYGVGEDVTLFLGAPARQTGLRTTVGLKQGKLAVVNGKIKHNEFNKSLFEGVVVDDGLLARKQQELLKKGRANQDIDVDQFLGLVRRAVDEDWVGKGRMRNAQ